MTIFSFFNIVQTFSIFRDRVLNKGLASKGNNQLPFKYNLENNWLSPQQKEKSGLVQNRGLSRFGVFERNFFSIYNNLMVCAVSRHFLQWILRKTVYWHVYKHTSNRKTEWQKQTDKNISIQTKIYQYKVFALKNKIQIKMTHLDWPSFALLPVFSI